MRCVFVQFQCAPGRTYDVADAIYDLEIASELYSTSGEYDLLAKIYIPESEDIGRFINEKLDRIDGIQRSLTTMTFKAF
jgi:DNA-binding Lrp family transcriptional regulator